MQGGTATLRPVVAVQPCVEGENRQSGERADAVERVVAPRLTGDSAAGRGPTGPIAPGPTVAPEPITPVVRETRKVGRNEPCPCGSGKKYKHCHGALAREA